MKLFFDIGYNKGEFTEACFIKHKKCNVIGVEANEQLIKRAHFKKNLTLLHYLASDVNGEKIDFFVEFNQNGISTASKEFMKESRFKKGSKYIPPNSSKWTHVGKVPTITLDILIKSYGNPDVIKIDVEGYELSVIKGLSQKTGKICFECHEEEKIKLKDIIRHLIKIGYDNFGFIGYIEEGRIFQKLTFSDKGDPYLVEPDSYYGWTELEAEINKCFIEDRRVNYGMFWAK